MLFYGLATSRLVLGEMDYIAALVMGQVWNTEMTTDFYHVSQEWAKQIAREAFGKIDFATVKMIKLTRNVSTLTFRAWGGKDFEKVELIKWYDGINDEYTRIGYSPYQNCIILGESYKHDNE